MSGEIHTGHFILGRDSEQVESVQQPETWHHGGRHPPDDHQNLDDLGSEQLGPSSHEQTVPTPGSIRLRNILLCRKQAREKQPPRPAPSVQLRSFQRIVITL
ncbi:hypothetical protein Mapa_016579 [Marchantia paleacea]|nr:hypothetical protein Mapa_016579 [Marchantia paleacea]